ncbi:MAG: NIPSNAP family containing protein [Phycisphaerales bacterium]|jgi:hypothetical protein|nr:NIPSNAP family containing protein [Phycisphaerales bacterium]
MKNIDRRSFLAGSAVAAATVAMTGSTASAACGKCAADAKHDHAGHDHKHAHQEFYELRAYRVPSAEKQTIIKDYFAKALVPALNKLGIDRVGVFETLEGKDLTLWVLIPFKTLDARVVLNEKLAADKAYQAAAKDFLVGSKKDPMYTRVESWLMKAFAGIPVIEMPAETKAGKDRIFEVRVYESHNEDAARRKVHMFNNGETQTMRDVKLAPVFFGETLIGGNVPNLTYMLSAPNMDEHKKHWKAFMAHPDWNRMKKMPLYKGTVSKIYNYFLKPLKCSQI